MNNALLYQSCIVMNRLLEINFICTLTSSMMIVNIMMSYTGRLMYTIFAYFMRLFIPYQSVAAYSI